MTSEWVRLKLSQQSLPPLLFQYTWSRQGYEVYVTDLTSIWSERLSQKDVLRRAEENATTIDPSEDVEQLDVLQTKIGEALRGDGGSARLYSRPQGDALEVITTTKLPAPLRPLCWSLNLLKESSSSLTDKVLIPILRDEAGWESRQRSLVDQLKQKDWVLGKLLDKFETLGVDLGTVFPGAAGLRTPRKGSTRSEAAKIIKGVAPFDESAWLAETAGSQSGTAGLAAKIINEISGPGRTQGLDRLETPHNEWWRTVSERTEMALDSEAGSAEYLNEEKSGGETQSPTRLSPHGEDHYDSSTASEDEFEQDPRIATSTPKQNLKTKQDDSLPNPSAAMAEDVTASESELESDPQTRRGHAQSVLPASKPAPPYAKSPEPLIRRKGTLGVIGGKKKKQEKEKSPPLLAPTPASPESVDAPEPATVPDSSSPASPAKAKRAAKLGTIGGKAKSKAVESKPSTQRLAVTSRTAHTATEPKEDQPVSKPVDAQRSSQKDNMLETEDEKALRRREELKRELQAKSKAPAKKKRRF